MKHHTRILRHPTDLADAVHALEEAFNWAQDKGKPLRVTLEVARKRRSTEQNARLWAIYTEIQQQVMAQTSQLIPTEEIHDECKRRILGMEQTAIGSRPRSTASQDVMTHMEYQDHVQRIAAQEWGVDWGDWEDGS